MGIRSRSASTEGGKNMYYCLSCLKAEVFETVSESAIRHCDNCNRHKKCFKVMSATERIILHKPVNSASPKIVATAFIQPDGEFTEKSYDFFTEHDLKINDLVVVRTVHGLSLAVVRQLDRSPGKANNWVVDKVDIEGFLQRRMNEEDDGDVL